MSLLYPSPNSISTKYITPILFISAFFLFKQHQLPDSFLLDMITWLSAFKMITLYLFIHLCTKIYKLLQIILPANQLYSHIQSFLLFFIHIKHSSFIYLHGIYHGNITVSMPDQNFTYTVLYFIYLILYITFTIQTFLLCYSLSLAQ